jgi:type IV fimbrial biogenesis protein FimT
MQQISLNRTSGLTLMELMIAVAILGIIISLSMPSFSSFRETQRLIGAAEQVYGHLQQARTESIARNVPVFVNFATDGSAEWVYGMSSVNSLCDLTQTTPTVADACVVIVDDGDGVVNSSDFVLMRYDSDAFAGVQMSRSNFTSGNSQIEFEPVRGMASAGQIDLAIAGGDQLRIRVSRLGRVTLCSPSGSVGTYSSTGC